MSPDPQNIFISDNFSTPSIMEFPVSQIAPTTFISVNDLVFYNSMFLDETDSQYGENKNYYVVELSNYNYSQDKFTPYSSFASKHHDKKLKPPFPAVPEAEYYGLIMFSAILFIVFFGGLRSRRKINK